MPMAYEPDRNHGWIGRGTEKNLWLNCSLVVLSSGGEVPLHMLLLGVSWKNSFREGNDVVNLNWV